MKIARVSGARLDLQDKDGRLNIFGTAAARQRAKDYVGYVLTQRTGPVYIDVKTKRDDLSIVSVPEVSIVDVRVASTAAVSHPRCTRVMPSSTSGTCLVLAG